MRRLHNWTYRNLTDFLKENGFSFLKELGGSHQQWIKRGTDNAPDRVLEIYFRHNAYPIGTMKTFIHKSGIPEREWLAWSRS